MLDRDNSTNIIVSPNSPHTRPGRKSRPGYFIAPDPGHLEQKPGFSDTSFNKLAQLSPLSYETVKPVKINKLSDFSKKIVKKRNAISGGQRCNDSRLFIVNWHKDNRCRPCKLKVINWVYTEVYPYRKPVDSARGLIVLVNTKKYKQLFNVVGIQDQRHRLKGADPLLKQIQELKYLSSITQDKIVSTREDISHSHSMLLKKAKAKYIAEPLAIALSGLDSPLKDSYATSIGCCSNLVQQGDKITGKYCKQRWCLVCNRIRTAQLINGYSPILDSFKDAYFVTLTVPNCEGQYLHNLIWEMQYAWRNIYKKMKRLKLAGHYGYLREQNWKKFAEIRGLKKIECTYNFKRNDFHPHYHFIIDGETQAHLLKWEWFKYWGGLGVKLSNDAQDVRPVEGDKAYLELFKYFTKLIVKDAPNIVYTQALDQIFKAMNKKRTFEPIGIRKVDEEIKELNVESYEHLKHENRFWTWMEKDWISEGDQLTGFVPGEISRIVKDIRKNNLAI